MAMVYKESAKRELCFWDKTLLLSTQAPRSVRKFVVRRLLRQKLKGGLKSEVDTLLPQGRDPGSTRKMRRIIIFHFFFFVTI